MKGNKFYIKETVTSEVFLIMEKKNYFNDEASDKFILGIILKHIRHKPDCLINYLECTEKYANLRKRTNQRIFDLLYRFGMPNRFERKIIAQDSDDEISQFAVVIELTIISNCGTLCKAIELPCDYIKWTFEKYHSEIH